MTLPHPIQVIFSAKRGNRQAGADIFETHFNSKSITYSLNEQKGYAAIDDFLFLPSEGSPSDDHCSPLPEVKIIKSLA